MPIKITFADGSIKIISDAVKVDYNYHEGTYDFCDEEGQPMMQLVMATGVTWSEIDNLDASDSKTDLDNN
jgi:hypothetical protein